MSEFKTSYKRGFYWGQPISKGLRSSVLHLGHYCRIQKVKNAASPIYKNEVLNSNTLCIFTVFSVKNLKITAAFKETNLALVI